MADSAPNAAEAAVTAMALGAPEGPSPSMRLANTLINTFAAIVFGLICVKLSLVSPGRGDTRAMGFYTGQVAYPLLIFKTVVNADLRSLDLRLVAACSAGKIAAALPTGVLAYFLHGGGRGVRSQGQRIVTAAIFAWFVVASNDFALGLPVIDALYGATDPNMAVNVAGNALVMSAIFMPMVFVLLEVGRQMQRKGDEALVDEERSDGLRPPPSSASSASSSAGKWCRVMRDILLNPVIVCTLLGVTYKLIEGISTGFDGQFKLPAILEDALDLFTGPFTMCALFLTGTTLQKWRTGFTPVALVLMKVVVCSYVSYAFARLLLPSTQPGKLSHENFAFFYGAIPTSTAPLVHASQFDPGSAELVATAVLIGLCLAAPLMFITAIFLTDEHKEITGILGKLQLSLHVSSCICGLFFLFTLLAMRRAWGYNCPAKLLLACYGVVLILYEAYMGLGGPLVGGWYCRTDLGWSAGVTYLQNLARFLIIAIQQFLVCDTGTSHTLRDGFLRLVACLMAAMVPALVASPNTLNEVCKVPLVSAGRLYFNLSWSLLCLGAAAFLGVLQMKHHWARLQGDSSSGEEEEAAEAAQQEESEEPGSEESAEDSYSRSTSEISSKYVKERWLGVRPYGVARMLSLLLILRLFMQAVNVIQVLTNEFTGGSFAVMMVVEALLEHAQLIFLLLALFMDKGFSAHLVAVLPEFWQSWLWQRGRISSSEVAITP